MTANYASQRYDYQHHAAPWHDNNASSDPFDSSYDTPTNYRNQSYYYNRNDDYATVHKKQLPQEIKDMKGRRKRRTVASGVAGGVVGLIALGPVGGIIGGVGSAVVAKKIGKRNEKRRMDEIEARQNPLRSSTYGELL